MSQMDSAGGVDNVKHVKVYVQAVLLRNPVQQTINCMTGWMLSYCDIVAMMFWCINAMVIECGGGTGQLWGNHTQK